MANLLRFPQFTLSKIMPFKEKYTDEEFKHGAQTKKKKNMKPKTYNELENIILENDSNKCIFCF
jgi:hypothetical protein